MAVPPRQHAVSHLQARFQRAPVHGVPADEPCRPWLCPVGALAGQYLTAELEEVQKADFARRMSSIMGKGTVDARALDPRPVVRARLYTCDPNGGNRVEIEPDPDTKELTAFNGQLICKAGLYPYNRDYERDGDLTRFAGARVTPSPLLPSSAAPQPDLASEFAYPPATLARAPLRPLAPHCEMAYALSGMRDLRARECQAYHEPVGKVALYFVFEDLRVSEVGHFVLKYSLIFLDNAFVARPDIKPPVLAKCWGGVFAIYPSKKAPPKEKSTDFGMFLYTNNLLSRPHTEKPANKRKAAQAEKEREKAAHAPLPQHQPPPAAPQANMFHPFPPPSGLAGHLPIDPFPPAQMQQGSSRQPQPPSFTFPFPPGAFPHAPGRDEGPLPRINVDTIRRAAEAANGSATPTTMAGSPQRPSFRRDASPPLRREEPSPLARALDRPPSRGRNDSQRGYADDSMRYRREDSPRRVQDSARRRSASPRRSPPSSRASPPRRPDSPPRPPDLPTPAPLAPTSVRSPSSGAKPAAVSAAELRAQELAGMALAQARHEAWLRSQYDPPPAPAAADIPPEVLAAVLAADDGGSEGSGGGGGVEEVAEAGKEGSLRIVAKEREVEQGRRRLKFDPVRDS
ncbi:hypothetical protein AURDEDRAFT_116316 [Auricularia subglabra TFB-10046 SS5]|nr:hypothetical protein AURDEDRAFT_116316 [Auricularia subglabra TFB-10046 SS5]